VPLRAGLVHQHCEASGRIESFAGCAIAFGFPHDRVAFDADYRADLALRYLREPSLTISQIAWLLGFEDVSAFTHAFRRWTGMSPSRVRATERWKKGSDRR
jgi:AraC-like DNA-binding protein